MPHATTMLVIRISVWPRLSRDRMEFPRQSGTNSRSPGSVAFPREVQHAAFLAATQRAQRLQLAEQQRIVACKFVAIDVQRSHAAKQQAGIV